MANITLITHTPDPERLVAAAAKLCYSPAQVDRLMEGLTPEKTASFLNKLVEMGHQSPLEHAVFTFALEGVSRALLAQITRHRMASFSVQSQRYVAENDFDYVIPPAIQENDKALEAFQEAMGEADEAYNRIAGLLEDSYLEELVREGKDTPSARSAAKKRAIEDARFVLPNACDTKMIVTMNARSLWNFFSLRCCQRAQWEIRAAAEEMLGLCKKAAPLLFQGAGPGCVRGDCPEGRMSCGRSKEMRSRFGREGQAWDTWR